MNSDERTDLEGATRQAGGKAVLVGVGLVAWLLVLGANASEFVRAWNETIGVPHSTATFITGYITLSIAPLVVIGMLQFIRGGYSDA